MIKPYVIVVCGPTAAGKTGVAIKLAQKLKTSIISADSRQFFKEMNIGTAKASQVELQQAPHFFVNNISISQPYSVGDFEKDVSAFLENYFKSNATVILAGGSGLYIDAVIKGFDLLPDIDEKIRQKLNSDYQIYGLGFLQNELKQSDPEYYKEVDIQNPQRIIRALEVCRSCGQPFSFFRQKNLKERPFNVVKIGINMEREILYKRINDRVDAMINCGLLEEVKSLVGYKKANALQTVGYQEIFDYLDGNISLSDAIDLVKRNTRRYAKRQLTWFRKDPEIVWYGNDETELMESYIRSKMQDSVI